MGAIPSIAYARLSLAALDCEVIVDKLLTIGQVAKRLRVSVDVVRSLTSTGRLKAVRTGGGHRRYSAGEIARFELDRRTGLPKRPPRPVTRVPLHRDPAIDEDPPSLADLKASAEPKAATNRDSADADRLRLDALKKHGCYMAIGALMPPEWQARVTRDLETFVTAEQVPAWLPAWQAQQIVEARVRSFIEQYHAAEARRRKRDEDERRLKALIDHGINRASWKTITGWDVAERERARREVRDVLKDQVEVDWSEAEVSDLVDDVLARWDGEDEEDDQDDEDDDEVDDGN